MRYRLKQKRTIIAIDGPAGAGKSTIAQCVARKLNFLYIDTGAKYRAITLKAQQEGIDFSNQARIIKMAKRARIGLKNLPDGTIRVFLDGCDVSTDIRKPVITKFVSDVAKIRGVRREMVALQRKLGSRSCAVLDGRDIGTVVFPQAHRKFFLDADFKERVRRRYKELKACGQKVTVASVAGDLKNRDTIDSTRKYAPLKQAKDAIYIDTTRMSIKEVVETLLKYISSDSV